MKNFAIVLLMAVVLSGCTEETQQDYVELEGSGLRFEEIVELAQAEKLSPVDEVGVANDIIEIVLPYSNASEVADALIAADKCKTGKCKVDTLYAVWRKVENGEFAEVDGVENEGGEQDPVSPEELVWVNETCEQMASKTSQSKCYREANDAMFKDELMNFYMGGFAKGTFFFHDRSEQLYASWQAVGKHFAELCDWDQRCMYDLYIREVEAIEEKTEWYELQMRKTNRAVYMEEVNESAKSKKPMLLHSDSRAMQAKFGVSNENFQPSWK